MKSLRTATLVLCAMLPVCVQAADTTADDLEAGFRNPPSSARPRVWWHWMNGNVTQEGVTEDLQWMKRVGIAGMQNFDAALATPQIVEKRLAFMTPEWKQAFRHAASLAADLDLELAIATSPGWSVTGGPWVTPQQAMKKVVWSATLIDGGRRPPQALVQPPSVAGPFQQIALPVRTAQTANSPAGTAPSLYADTHVLAFAVPDDELADRSRAAQVTSASGAVDASLLSDGDLTRTVTVPVEKDGTSWLRVEYARPTTIRSATLSIPVRHGFGAPPQFGATLEASDDGKSYRVVGELSPSRADQRTVAFAPVTARWFRVVFKAGAPFSRPLGDGVAPMQFPPAPPTMAIAELALHQRTHVNRFVEKAGFAAAPDYYALDTPPATSGSIVPLAAIVDLTGKLNADGRLDWTPPRGKWLVLRFGYSLTGHMNGPASAEATGLEVDKLNPAHVRAYLTRYLDMYESAVGKDLMGARGLRALLTDSYEAGAQNWTENMLAEFVRVRGYDARPWLPTLAGWIVESPAASDRFLWDFRRTITDLFADAHYGQIKQIASERGLVLYGEALEDQRPALGDDMAMRKHADIPMAAMWTYPGREGPYPTYIADHRGAASVAHIYGQNIAAAESLTAFGYPWAFAPRDLQPVADLQFALGINRIVVHTSVHQPLSDRRPGMALRPLLGQYFNRTETWAEQAGPWVDYLSRSSYLLQQGKYVADVAYFYGQEAPITGLFGAPGAGLQPADQPRVFAFDFVNDDVVLNRLSVQDGRLVTASGMSYAILYLGGSSRRMTLGVLRKLDQLVRAGATVVGAKPTGSPSLADDAASFGQLADELWGDDHASVRAQDAPNDASLRSGGVPGSARVRNHGKGRVMRATPDEALREIGVSKDFDLRGTDPTDVMFLHRRTSDADIYFVSNRTSRALSGEAAFRVQGRAPELWDAESSTIEALAYRSADGQTRVPLDLAPLRSAFVVFRRAASAPPRVVALKAERVVAIVNGPWQVQFETRGGGPAAPVSWPKLASWTDQQSPSIRYFSGTATYATTFDAPKNGGRLVLDLGDVRELATVRLNGKKLSTLWRPPFRVDVTDAIQPGSNQLSVEVTNLWVNRLIGDAQPGVTPITFTTGPTYLPNAPLRPSGLLGPVRIIERH